MSATSSSSVRIRVTESNFPAIAAALKSVNGRADSFTITQPETIEVISLRAGKALDALSVPLKERTGSVYYYRTSGPSAVSYGHASIGNEIELTAGSKGDWFLTKIARRDVFGGNRSVEHLISSPRAVAAAVYHAARASGIDKVRAEAMSSGAGMNARASMDARLTASAAA